MVDGKALSSDNDEYDEEQHQRDSVHAVIENGAELSNLERASISRKRSVTQSKGQYKSSRTQESMSKMSVYY